MKKKWFAVPLACILALNIGFQPIAAEEAKDYQNFEDVVVEIGEISDPEPIVMDSGDQPVRFEFEESDITDDFPMTRASGYDLAIGNLEIDRAEPLPYAEYTNFEMLIGNIGTETINDVHFLMYLDDNLYSSQGIGDFSPGYGGTIKIPVKGLAGTHKITFKISAGSGITETNTNNNEVSATLDWEDTIDLAADFVQYSGPLHIITYYDFRIPIINYGNLPAEDVEVVFEISGQELASGTFDIPASTKRFLTLSISFNTYGEFEATTILDPDKKLDDPERSNNEQSTGFEVPVDEEEFLGRYHDATNRTVAIGASVQDILYNKGLPYAEVKNAIMAWNSLDTNVRITAVDNVSSEDIGDHSLLITRGSFDLGEDFAAVTDPVFDEDGYIVNGQRAMPISYQYFSGQVEGTTKAMKLRTLTHEIGHFLGLSHPTCENVAIMQQSHKLESGIASYAIEMHDIRSLQYLYR